MFVSCKRTDWSCSSESTVPDRKRIRSARGGQEPTATNGSVASVVRDRQEGEGGMVTAERRQWDPASFHPPVFHFKHLTDTWESLASCRTAPSGLLTVCAAAGPQVTLAAVKRKHGDSGHRAEKVHQEGEVDGGGRCPQPHSERGEWKVG